MRLRAAMLLGAWLIAVGAGPQLPIPAPTRRPIPPSPCAQTCITPAEAVGWASAISPKGGLAGTFAFYVPAGTSRGKRYYLYAEPNLYDCDCLTIILSAELIQKIAAGQSLDDVGGRFIGKWIEVKGTAYRKHVEVLNIDKPTGRYHDPVEIVVDRPEDIVVH